jgi:hypothetical protein
LRNNLARRLTAIRVGFVANRIGWLVIQTGSDFGVLTAGRSCDGFKVVVIGLRLRAMTEASEMCRRCVENLYKSSGLNCDV